MKRLALVAALASLAAAPVVFAQSVPPDYTPPPSAGAPLPAPSGSVPAMPSLDANQSAEVQRQLAPYRSQVDARVARGEISADDAGRLLQWREWQIAQQVGGRTAPPRLAYNQAPQPGDLYDQAPPPNGAYDQGPPPNGAYDQGPPPAGQPYYAQPYYPQPYAQPYYAPYYGPYYAPYYYGPRYYRPAPYYWGASICAGGWGHHGGARVCF
jgi:hypothetical protein